MDFDFSQFASLFAVFAPMAGEAFDLLARVPWGLRALLLLWLLWVFYLAVMNLKRVHSAGKLGKVALALGMPVLIVGYVLDVLANVVVFTVLLLELPRWGEWTVTARLQRHHVDETWRGKVAQWFETELLGEFDPAGRHVARSKPIDA